MISPFQSLLPVCVHQAGALCVCSRIQRIHPKMGRDSKTDDGGAGGWPLSEGGRAGFVVIVTMWTRGVLRAGILKGMGIMLLVLQEQFVTDTWVIGEIVAMIIAFSGVSAPFAGLASRRFGRGWVVMVCGSLIGLAFILGSLATSTVMLALILTILAGIPFGIPQIITKDAVGRSFGKSHGLATGIGRTGTSFGLIAYTPLIQLFLNTYGWRGTMLLIGGVSMHLVVCGALMTVTPIPEATDPYRRVPVGEAQAKAPSEKADEQTSTWNNLAKKFDVQLLWSPRYWSVAWAYFSVNYAYEMWLIYYVSQAQSNGLSLEQATSIITVAGVGNLLAKIGQGLLVDRGIVSCWNLMFASSLVSAAAFCATPWAASYWLSMLTASLVVISDGLLSCLHDVLTKQVLGVENLAGAYGWMDIQLAIIRLSLGFLPGLLYDRTGSYVTAFLFLGFVQFAQVFPLIAIKCLQRSSRV